MPELIICCANRSVYELLVERTSDDFKFRRRTFKYTSVQLLLGNFIRIVKDNSNEIPQKKSSHLIKKVLEQFQRTWIRWRRAIF